MKDKNTDNQKKEVMLNRREALKKLGKHSAYTAPALMTLLFSTKATALTPPSPPGGG